MRFVYPIFFILFLVIPFLFWYYFRPGLKLNSTIKYSDLSKFKGIKSNNTAKFYKYLSIPRIVVLALIIIAFTRPQAGQRGEEVETEGVDILLCLDVSGTMQAEDFKPNRLEAAKNVITKFIKGRKTDRIGLVVFSGESFTQVPLTLDYGMIVNSLKEIKFGMIQDGTAIGMGLANGLNRLRFSKSKSKVIVLLTDGMNNAGSIDPITAAKLADAINVKIYTIGVGSMGPVPIPVQDPVFGKRYVMQEVGFDEPTLKEVADITAGRYFRASDLYSLEMVFKKINELEKTRIKTKQFLNYYDLFPIFLMIAFIFFICDVTVSNTLFRRIP